MHSISTSARPRRVAAVAAFSLLVATALAGCGASGGGGDAANSGTVTVANPADLTPSMIKAFEKAYPKIKLKVQNFDGDSYSQKITSLVASNQAPDVMILFENDAIRLASSGSIIKLDDRLKGGSLTNGDFIPAVSKLSEKTDGTYGLPWCYATQVLYYNKDVFDAAGVKYPTANWTWDDYRQAAIKTSSGTGGSKIWGVDSFSFPGIWYSLAGQAGDQVIDGKGNLVLGSGIKRALQFTNQLTNEDKVQPQPPTSGTSVTDLFSAGKSAMALNGSWAVNTYKDAKFRWDVAPMPRDKTSYTTLHTAFYTISKTSKHQDAAWTFIKFMMSKKGQQLTSEASSNPSAIKSLAGSTAWQHPGANGPTDYKAITDSAGTFGAFGYTLASFTTSNDLGADFNSYLLGAKSLDDVMSDVKAKASGK